MQSYTFSFLPKEHNKKMIWFIIGSFFVAFFITFLVVYFLAIENEDVEMGVAIVAFISVVGVLIYYFNRKYAEKILIEIKDDGIELNNLKTNVLTRYSASDFSNFKHNYDGDKDSFIISNLAKEAEIIIYANGNNYPLFVASLASWLADRGVSELK